jgi:hypothetical protein
MAESSHNTHNQQTVGYPELDTQLAQAIEKGIWPEAYFQALMSSVEQWAQIHPTSYHHTGYTYPDQAAFDAAVASAPGIVIANDMKTPTATHHRRYLRQPAVDGSMDTFIEYHRVGDDGNGVQGVHFDFVTDDPQAMLEYVRASLGALPDDVRVVTQPFGGGTAPVGKIELLPIYDPTIAVGVMARTYWSDPANW